MKQQTLMGFERFGKTTRRAKFLSDMDRIIPWKGLTAAVELSRTELFPGALDTITGT